MIITFQATECWIASDLEEIELVVDFTVDESPENMELYKDIEKLPVLVIYSQNEPGRTKPSIQTEFSVPYLGLMVCRLL